MRCWSLRLTCLIIFGESNRVVYRVSDALPVPSLIPVEKD
jgi:hypothetical protein